MVDDEFRDIYETHPLIIVWIHWKTKTI
jgi:hypothetical protein